MEVTSEAPILVTIPQISNETGVSLNWLYQRSRKDSLPGLRRLGRNLRIDRREFYAALEAGTIE